MVYSLKWGPEKWICLVTEIIVTDLLDIIDFFLLNPPQKKLSKNLFLSGNNFKSLVFSLEFLVIRYRHCKEGVDFSSDMILYVNQLFQNISKVLLHITSLRISKNI